MTALQLAENPMLVTAQDKLEGVVKYLGGLPVSVWRYLVLFLCLLWLVHSFAGLFWLVFPTPELEQPKTLATPVTQVSVSSESGVDKSLLGTLRGIFGTVDSKAPVVVAPKPEIPDDDVDIAATKLNLKLQGVIGSSDPSKGSAIIADGNDQSLYSIGDEIGSQKGVKLAKVLEQRVILDNRGKHESLWLYSEEDFKKSPNKGRSTSRRVSTRNSKRAQANNRNKAPSPVHARVKANQIPKSIGDVVRFSVHREGGEMKGYRVRPGRDRKLFEQFGLKANDIVTSVNGIEVNDPKQIRSVYKSLKTATEAQLTILRDGSAESIHISLDSGG
ncbi:MAG: type II secretion system protein GspC [Alteromonadaceae bacterium]|nr:MAG: type II secretion system protein GspC [Alteromonadaceae bacterium]